MLRIRDDDDDESPEGIVHRHSKKGITRARRANIES